MSPVLLCILELKLIKICPKMFCVHVILLFKQYMTLLIFLGILQKLPKNGQHMRIKIAQQSRG